MSAMSSQRRKIKGVVEKHKDRIRRIRALKAAAKAIKDAAQKQKEDAEKGVVTFQQ